MAAQLQNLKGLFTNVKTRTIIIFTAALMIIGVMIGVVGVSQKTKPTAVGPSSAASVPEVNTQPGIGQAPSVQYAQIQALANQQQVQQAKLAGTSAIPTIIGQAQNQNAQTSTSAPVTQPLPQAQVMVAPIPTLGGSSLTVQDRDTALRTGVDGQLSQLIGAWTKVRPQSLVNTGINDTAQAAASAYANVANNVAGVTGSTDVATAATPLVRAGDIMFAILNTELNSDDLLSGGSSGGGGGGGGGNASKAPVLATIVSGPFTGAKLLGSMQRSDKKLILAFNLMSRPSAKNSDTINTVAIDPDTARTALSSHVNNHYLLRYGSLFASAFVQGYGQALQQSGTTSTTSSGFFGSTTTTSTPQRSQNELYKEALAQVGQAWSQSIAGIVNKPPTVTLGSGTSLGILFLSDFTPTQGA